MDEGTNGHHLKCSIEPFNPFLDFAFRFEAGFVARCALAQFEGKQDTLLSLIRITPQGHAPVVMGGKTKVPAIPADMLEQINPSKLKNSFEVSGAFSTGEGRYSVTVLLRDNSERVCQKRWTIRAALRHADHSIPVALNPGTVRPMVFHPWNGKLNGRGTGLRVTFVLDAAPIIPFEPKLQAWDRALLMESLLSLLKGIPCQSVRLAAFNLDQQKEIFEEDPLDRSGFVELEHRLHDFGLETVSYHILQRHEGWANLLAKLANHELARDKPADAVIFLGPRVSISQKMPAGLLKARETKGPRFFYFEYFPYWQRGGEFSDSIGLLTRAVGGTEFKIDSPGELAKDIQKMLVQLRPNGKRGD